MIRRRTPRLFQSLRIFFLYFAFVILCWKGSCSIKTNNDNNAVLGGFVLGFQLERVHRPRRSCHNVEPQCTLPSEMVSLHGHTSLTFRRSLSKTGRKGLAATTNANGNRIVTVNHLSDPPPDPNSLLSQEKLEEKAQQLAEWLSTKRSVFCLTGAGLSTESGIPDYRGHKGSYHVGHKPVIHQMFMEQEYQRKRYWGR